MLDVHGREITLKYSFMRLPPWNLIPIKLVLNVTDEPSLMIRQKCDIITGTRLGETGYNGNRFLILWQVYLVLCNDGTLYCGISRDVDLRVKQHNEGKGAKYTRSRLPVYLVWYSAPMVGRSEATREETRIKKLSRKQKWDLIKGEVV